MKYESWAAARLVTPEAMDYFNTFLRIEIGPIY